MQHTNDNGADSSSPSEDDADETDNNTNDDAVIRGYLFKRHSRTVSMQEHWKSRYFVLLSDNTLEYYRSEDDAKPKDRFLLGPGCTISDLFVEKYKKKPLYCMRVHFERSVLDDSSHDGSAGSLQSTTGEQQQHHMLPKSPLRKFFRKPTAETNSTDHPDHHNTFDDDADDAICAELRHAYYTQQQHQHKKTYHKLIQGTQLVAAAGAAVGVTAVTAFTGGLVAGAIALGVAGATGGGAVALRSTKKQQQQFVVASPEYRTMKRWRAVLLAAREALDHRNWWCDAKTARAALVPADDSSSGTTAQSPLPQLQKWTPVDGGWVVAGWAPGLRLTRSAAAWKASVVIETTALDAFVCCMSKQASAVLESMDAHTDIVRLVLRPLTLGITQTTPRDCVLYRYWRLEQDGTYVICYQSVEHAACPPSRDHVRAELHAVYTIAPPAKQRKGGGGGMLQQQQQQQYQQMNTNCCLMTGTVQLDPKGWIPTLPLFHQQSYSDVFAVVALNNMLDMRDEIDRERFVDTAARKRTRPNDITSAPPGIARNQSTDTNDTAEVDGVNYDFAFASHESHHDGSASTTGFTLVPRPLSSTFWAEPDSNSFRVRGQTYKDDHLKVNAGRSIARLVAVDIVTVDEPIYTGFSMHPGERIQLALQKEKELKRTTKSDLPPFIFVVNIVLPGPPFYHMVYYYAIDDMSTIDGSNGTPSSQLCQQFFFGECDEFRDATFKLIPQIIDGHFLVRKAVGSTPAIMGKKLRQLYVRRKRWMEVILDCGSSPVATGVIRLSVGYAKTLVVDMGFVLQGDEPEVLPERIFGCARIKNIVMEGPHIRHVETMPPVA